ncbi:MAG: flagellar basal body-associated FliL family protein [Anaerolineales bacterium]|nr:flagellar basal body-associated FliL family protein [Anaerolineales bacterium]
MKNILKLLPKILMILGGLTVVGVNLAIAYIMFAPDNLPKPFYLMYAATADQAAGGVAPSDETSLEPSVAQAAEAPEIVATPVLERGQGFMVDTGTKIINLVDQTGRKYLRAGVVLEFVPQDPEYYSMAEEEKTAYETAFNEEMGLKLPVINDIIITLLSSQTYESVYTAEGKEILRQKILEQVNEQLPENNVIFVYFTEFVVQ